MNVTALHFAPGPATLDRITSLLGITAAWSLVILLAAGVRPLHPALYLAALALALAVHRALDARCGPRPPRVRSLAGFLWAPAGRFRRVPTGTPLLAAKRYHFNPSQAYQPMLVWVGWWNCRTFTGDPASAEYFFLERGSTRYAIPARDLVPADPPRPPLNPMSPGTHPGVPGLPVSTLRREKPMNRSTATVKWYDPQLGHGILTPEGGGPDVFVHHSALHGSGLGALGPGDRVEYESVQTELGPAAESVLRTR